MTPSEFYQFRDELNNEASQVMGVASDEYASEGDKFFNFKAVAEMLQSSAIGPYEVACIYALKHIFSIVRGVSKREGMRGRFIDARNYIDLLAGIWEELHQEGAEQT